MLILVAALSIGITAVQRLMSPKPLEQVGLGIGVSIVASFVNLAVSLVLRRAGKQFNSISLKSNAQHLMTDVWTSAGVLVGVGAVALTGWERLDPIVALVVAGNIVWSGFRIVKSSVLGLMDTALSVKDQETLQKVLEQHLQTGIQVHALRTRQSGPRRFISMHVLVPGIWTVQRGHQLLEQIEADIRYSLPTAVVFTHLESLNDSASWDDMALDRVEESFEKGN